MRSWCGNKWVVAFLVVSAITLVSASEPVDSASVRADADSPKIVCTPAPLPSSVVNNTSTVNQSLRTGNRSSSTSSINNRAATAPLPASITVSNSCAPLHGTGIDSATSAALAVAVLNLANKAQKENDNDSSDIWKSLKELAPVFQTLLWVLLIVCLVKRFARTINRLVLRLGDRLQKVHIKMPFGELFADIGPIPEGRRKSRVVEEMPSQPGRSDPSARTPGMPRPSRPAGSRTEAMRMYYEAEDFVIRTLEQEFGTSILQNVQTGTHIEMDGFFTRKATPYVIEVKLVQQLTSLREPVARLVGRLKQEERFDNVRVILALVYVEELRQPRQRLIETELFRIDPTISIRWFSLSQLRNRFVDEPETGDQ